MAPAVIVAVRSARRAAIAIALTSPIVALGSIDLGFHLLPCYPLIAAGLVGVIARREWRIVTMHGADVMLLSFAAIATVVTVGNLGVHPGTTVVGATGANSVHLRPVAQLVALLAMVGLYVVMRVGVRSPDDLRSVLRALLVATLFVAAYAAYQVVGRQFGLPYTFVNERRGASSLPTDVGYVRPNSTLPEASPLAQFAFIAFFIGIACLLVRQPRRDWPSRPTALLLAITGLFLILASLSKAAWVAGAVCLPIIIWQLTRRRAHAVAAFAAAAGAVAIVVGLRMHSLSLDIGPAIDSETYIRVGYWIAAIQTAAHHPLGVGVGNFPFYYPQFAPLSVKYEYFSRIADAHNLFLEAAAETGIVGGLLFLGFVVGLLGRGVRLAAKAEPALRAVFLGLAAAYATGALMHLTYSYFYYPFEWVLAGLLGAIAWHPSIRHPFDVDRA
jgi:hypothetical protein